MLSLVVVRWLHWATYNSRAFLPAARALVSKDVPRAIDLLTAFEERYQPDRFFEIYDLKVSPSSVTLMAAVAQKDREKIIAAAQRAVAVDEELLPRRFSYQWRTEAGVEWPLHQQGKRVRFGRLRQAACVTSDWKLAISILREALSEIAEFWRKAGGKPVRTDLPLIKFNVYPIALQLISQEREYRVLLAWALAQDSQYDAALEEIETLLAEPMAHQAREDYVRGEVFLLKAAIEWKQGNTDESRTTYQAAQQTYLTPVVFDHGDPGQSGKLPELSDHGYYDGLPRPENVAESWRGLRHDWFSLGRIPPDHSGQTRVWSLDDNPRDLTDDFMDEMSKEGVR